MGNIKAYIYTSLTETWHISVQQSTLKCCYPHQRDTPLLLILAATVQLASYM